MLENSFVHLPGIGAETEARLWALGCRSWQDLADNVHEHFGKQKANKVSQAIEESLAASEAGEWNYFRTRFKGAEMWRLVPALIRAGHGNSIAFLDIETTGLGFPPASVSTSIAVQFEGELLVAHKTDEKIKILERISQDAKMLVTFNGVCFDIPFLRREFDLPFEQAHLDLRYWFARLECKGGLKIIQKSFPNVPQRHSMDIDGFDAVRLWSMHQRGYPRALETLLTYNAEDTIVLEQLVYTGLNLEAKRRPHLGLPTYEMPAPLKIKTTVCPNVYKALRSY